MKRRFYMALGAYGVLALMAGFTLERVPRTVVWLLLFALAVKTWIAFKRAQD
jgi:hypothetical protein